MTITISSPSYYWMTKINTNQYRQCVFHKLLLLIASFRPLTGFLIKLFLRFSYLLKEVSTILLSKKFIYVQMKGCLGIQKCKELERKIPESRRVRNLKYHFITSIQSRRQGCYMVCFPLFCLFLSSEILSELFFPEKIFYTNARKPSSQGISRWLFLQCFDVSLFYIACLVYLSGLSWSRLSWRRFLFIWREKRDIFMRQKTANRR